MQPPHARPFMTIMLVMLAIALSGCAALFTPPLQHVPIDSAPPGAEVFVDGRFVGTTPITLELESHTDYELLLRIGDNEHSVTLSSSIDAAYVALDIAPGLVMAGVSALIFATTPDPGPRSPSTGVPDLGPVIRSGLAIGGIAVGLGSAAINVAIDAGTGRWYHLTPSEVLIAFD